MKERLAKLRRLLAHRERQTGQELASLALAVQEEKAASADLAREKQRLDGALLERRRLGNESVGVSQYIQLDDWSDTLSLRHQKAAVTWHQAAVELKRVRARIVAAKVRERQVQTLIDSMRAKIDLTARRIERRVEDEVAQIITQKARK